MTAPGFVNWADLGFFPLQDHEDGVPTGMRQQLAAGRIVSMSDSDDPAESVHVIATEDGMGTIGDLHPWFFWQTADREERATGMWQGSFAGLVVEGKAAVSSGTSTGARPSGLLPIRTARGGGSADGRMKTKYPNVSKAMPFTPRGTMMLVMPGTDEANQQEIMLHCDSRIMAPNMFGPGSAGTLVCDMGPENEICMSDGVGGLTNSPGMAGRAARIQSLMRVIPFDASGGISRGNALALNFAASGQDGLAGFGLAWTAIEKAGAGGPTTGGAYSGPGDVVPTRPPGYKGPTTPSGGPSSNASGGGSTPMGASGSGDGPGGQGGLPGSLDGVTGGPEGGNENAGGRGRHPADGATVADFGKFEPRVKTGFGTMALSASMGGPLHGGSDKDPHKVGSDRDGNPINSAHLATAANWYRTWKEDGPMLFEGDYPGASGFPLKAHTHLTWDAKGKVWRWWTEVPDLKPSTNIPPTTPGDKPPPWKPHGPTTPSGPGPSGPGPSGPPNPGGGGKPSTPGPSGPSGPGPSGPSGPSTGGPPRGGPSGRGPFTPGPFGGYPRGAGYGWRAPGSPKNPKGPWTGGGGYNPPSPVPIGPAFGGDGPPGPNEDGPPGRGPGQTPKPGFEGPSTGTPSKPKGGKGAGWRAAGSPPTGPEPGKLEPIVSTNATREDETSTRVAARDIGKVGETTIEDRGLMSYFRPTMSGFAGLTFRPQKWIKGETNFLHNTQHDYDEALEDEAHRPQVVALHAFGATSIATGEFAHVATPQNSRARGGTGDGGVMFTPPEFEPEDYFGINSYVDVETAATESLVMLTPGVALALGTPTVAGGLNVAGIAISQKFAATDKPLQVQQYSSAGVATTLFEARVSQTDSEERVTFSGTHSVRIPQGNTAQRPTTPLGADFRLNDGSDNPFLEYYNATAAAWVTVTDANTGGGGGATTFIALTDTPAGYTASNLVRVNAGATALEYVDGDTLYTPTADVFEHDGSVAMTGIPDFGGFRLSNLGSGALGTDAFSITQALATFVNVTGGTMTGWLTVQADNIGVAFGASGADALIYHDGTDFALNAGLGEVKFFTGLKIPDSESIFLGTGLDATIKYDGTDMIIDPAAVGSGNLQVKADIELDDSDKLMLGTGGDCEIYYSGSSLVINPQKVGSGTTKHRNHFDLDWDNRKVRWGAAQDCYIHYDGTDMILKPDSVGTGKVKIDGDINVVLAHDYYHNAVAGETASISFYDGASELTHTVEISGGIITQWTTA